MTKYEIISGTISLLAIFVSVISIRKSEAASRENAELAKKQLALEEVQAKLNMKLLSQLQAEEKERETPCIDIEYEKSDEKYVYYFVLENKGYQEARKINLEFISDPKPSVIDMDGLIPCERLKPKAKIRIIHIPTLDNPASKYTAKIEWSDENGKQFTDEKDVYVN